MTINEKQIRYTLPSLQEVIIDWEMHMANSITAQILNSEHCKKNYARILAIAALKISDALRYQDDN
jgi:hypothetical protein